MSRGTLATLVVHDLKNALGALEGELGALAGDGGREDLRRAHRHCRALRERFVMYLSLYGPDGLVARPEDESPAGLLQALAEGHEGTPPPRLVIDTMAAPAFWFFDHRLVRMALDAALHNARRFARDEIRLEAFAADGGLVLRIDDDGPGPDAESEAAARHLTGGAATARHLTAGEPAAAHGALDTGLGTALCQAVAHAHRHRGRHGRARLAARPGGGARFELWLP